MPDFCLEVAVGVEASPAVAGAVEELELACPCSSFPDTRALARTFATRQECLLASLSQRGHEPKWLQKGLPVNYQSSKTYDIRSGT